MKRHIFITILTLLAAAFCAVGVYAAPQKAAGGIMFSYTDPNAGAVAWAGEFNAWNVSASPLVKGTNGVWSVVIALPPGDHEYKFVVDGTWITDPENPVTHGDFGNSVVSVGKDGDLTLMRATSNTAYSPKIFMGGRVIGTYQSIRNDETKRFELRRPDMDIDFGFDIRMSEALSAHILTNIRSETEDVEFFRTRLNFDRGSLSLLRPHLNLFAYDNESAGTWDDPMHLVGDVGIYSHAYGFERQGFRLSSDLWGLRSEFHYSDNFRPGGTSYPGLGDAVQFTASLLGVVDSLRTVRSGTQFVLAPGQVTKVHKVNVSDNNEDMFAVRLRRDLRKGFTLGVLGRTDRGFDLGSTVFARPTRPLAIERVYGDFEKEWFAAGAELAAELPHRFGAFAEFLHGRERMNFISGASDQFEVTAADSTGVKGLQHTGFTDLRGHHFELDRSNRVRVGGTWSEAHEDIMVRAEVEHQTHDYEIEQPGLSSAMTAWRLQWDRNWRYYVSREATTRLDLEFINFDYAANTPWNYQLWFPTGNFWLEHGEHVVGFDRLLMLGGNDVVRVRPAVKVPIKELDRRIGHVQLSDFTFNYDGTFNSTGIDRRPRYIESLFRFRVNLTPQVRVSTDTRWAKYDDRALGLARGYVSHFGELAYQFAPGVRVALGLGVDPVVLDTRTNEFAPIGRDAFLFERGANAINAETDYFGLGAQIDAAERALHAQRRVQIRAHVTF